MARAGSFGTSLNPFASNSGSSLGQYSIGDSIRDLEAYRAEIAWGNGTITDEEYRLTLVKLVGTATPNSTSALSAQNKLDDVTYRIGRSQADAKGPDALIAFDQQALAGMNTGNLRYRDVKSSLDSELASRRSRDYGIITDNYNAGKTSTESLMAWVQKTVATLPADAPDKDNWASVQSSLTDRLVSEKDAQIYQDYQDRKMAPADFVAYLTGRRDAYAFSSPKYAEADRRLQDAQKNVKDAAQSVVDQDFANKYTDGKISDTQYLVYLSKRIDGMAADDPTLPEWKQKLTQAAHSLAEDKLRYDVNVATTAAGQAAAARNLSSFYEAYRSTLNPGSAEWRATTEQIHTLAGYTSSGGSSGGGGGSGGGGTKKKAAATGTALPVPPGTPKIISATGSFDAAIALMTPNAGAPKKAQTISVDNLRLNLQSATYAKNDKVWLYSDPRYPGQMVAKQTPDGKPVLDAKGKPVMVPGSSYRASSDNERAQMQMATATYSYQLAGVAAGKGDDAGYWTAIWHADTALEAVRNTQVYALQRDLTGQLDALQKGVDLFTKSNNPGAAVDLLTQMSVALQQAIAATPFDDAQRIPLQTRLDKVNSNPLVPEPKLDINGEPVVGPDGFNIQIGGMYDAANNAYAPGVHFSLDKESGWGPVKEPNTSAPGDWTATHLTVKTSLYGKVVAGDVSIQTAPVNPLIQFTDTNDVPHTVKYTGGAAYSTFTDENGQRVNSYSVDGGKTWIQTTGGELPVLQVNVPLTEVANSDGSISYQNEQGKDVFKSDANGNNWTFNNVPDAASAGQIGWLGQQSAIWNGTTWSSVPQQAGVATGAPDQRWRIVTTMTDSNGETTVDLVPDAVYFAQDRAEGGLRAETAAVKDRVGGLAIASLGGYAAETAAVKGRGFVIPYGPAAPPIGGSLAAESAAVKNRNIWNGTPAVGQWSSSPASYTAGAAASSSLHAETLAVKNRGIIAAGVPVASPIQPPTHLLPAYVPTTVFSAPTLTPLSAPILKPVTLAPPVGTTKVTSPTGVTKIVSSGVAPVSGALYEGAAPNPAPYVAPKPAPKPVLHPRAL